MDSGYIRRRAVIVKIGSALTGYMWVEIPDWQAEPIAPGVTRCPTDPDNSYPLERSLHA
jgi:hypothetical protein